MSSQEFARSSRREDTPPPELPTVQPSVQTDSVDSLLDEIDSILVTNAESFVQGFVQKGGE